MKKHALATAASLALALGASSAATANPLGMQTGYLGLSASMAELELKGLQQADATVPVLRLGYFLFDSIAIEGRAGFGTDSDRVNGIDVELDNVYGGYLIGHLPLAPTFSVYALAGISRAEGTATVNAISSSTSTSGFSWGFGGELVLSPALSLGLEYTHYLNESDFDLSAVGATVKLNF